VARGLGTRVGLVRIGAGAAAVLLTGAGVAAVKAGKAFDVPAEVWMTGIGVTAANKILDDVQKHLLTA
jgi:hypothetical protein